MSPELTLRAAWLHWPLRLAAIVLLAVVIGRAFGAEGLVRSAQLLALAGAATVTTWAVLMLLAVSTAATPILATLRWATLGGLATGVLAVATGALARDAAALAAGTFLLGGAFGLTLTLAAAALRDRLAAAALALAVAGLATATPLWLGPIAERFAATPVLVDAIVAVSPLTYLAVLADFDYLRATWFYEHSSLGSLRYDYPAALSQSVVYALPLVAAAALKLPLFSKSRLAKEQPR
jgi:hypothetical protein